MFSIINANHFRKINRLKMMTHKIRQFVFEFCSVSVSFQIRISLDPDSNLVSLEILCLDKTRKTLPRMNVSGIFMFVLPPAVVVWNCVLFLLLWVYYIKFIKHAFIPLHPLSPYCAFLDQISVRFVG